ncbi:MAG: FtsX-like permease family protein [Planctomycetaceae bacterium]
MRRFLMWVRWSARDLRARWVQVVATALIIAIGTGTTAAVGSMTIWRHASYDASYARSHHFDVRVQLAEGSVVPQGSLLDAMTPLVERGWVAAAEERLSAPTQVDASRGGETVLVPGRLVGVDQTASGPHVSAIAIQAGRGLGAADVARPAGVLEAHFADHYALPSSGTIGLAGGTRLPYVGTGYAPEYFIVTTAAGGLLAEANYAVVFVPLAVAQELSGSGGGVNDLVVRLSAGVSRTAARRVLASAIEERLPRVAATVSTVDDDPAWRALYGDLESDQGTMNAVAALIFAAAAFAAFSLTSRIVEARRREIGVAMAIGQRPWSIAIRPVLMGFEIALLGVAFGVGVGLLIAEGLKGVLESMQPMPVWQAPFQPGSFARAAAIGLVLPIVATLWPVWRAVRIQPVDAIRTGHLAAKGGGLAPLVRRATSRGRSMTVMPVRNVLRAPRRTMLTALGIAAAITSMVGLIGLIDSFNATVDRGAAEVRAGAADRLEVALAGFQPVDGPVVAAVVGAPGVRDAVPSLRVGAKLEGTQDLDVQLEVMDLANGVWHPTVRDAADPAGKPGVVLADKAATDLGVVPGDTISVEHPVFHPGRQAVRSVVTEMRVVGLHPYPMRGFAYVDLRDAAALGMAGIVNAVQVAPAPGADLGALKRTLFEIPGVASTQPADATVGVLRDLMARFMGIFRFLQLFVLLLAVLIAFNAASIGVEERAREHATMFAFGVRLRSVLREITAEGLIVGLVGTVIGVGLGMLAVRWLTSGSAEEMPDLQLFVTVAPATIATAFVMGVAAVALAPLFTARKLRRTDIPSTLRVME